jgi:hypothetical protein
MMRVSFNRIDGQKLIMDKILSKVSVKEAAVLVNCSERTIRDWRRGKFLVDQFALKKLCHKARIKFPKNINKIKDYWYVGKGSSLGGKAVFKKYGAIGGNPVYRKKCWLYWWETKGKYQSSVIGISKPIKKPKFSEELAEFAGIILGDGNISDRQVKITLNSEDDKEYGKFIIDLIKSLFNVPIGIYSKKNALANDYVISRTELVKFCISKIGLKKGNKTKQKVDIPDWIKRNKKYSLACLRGLIDTDGCVFNHKYKVKNKWYLYKKIAFTTSSEPLRASVFNILKDFDLNPRLAGDRDVRIDCRKDVHKYFKIVKSHNQKHLNKILNEIE